MKKIEEKSLKTILVVSHYNAPNFLQVILVHLHFICMKPLTWTMNKKWFRSAVVPINPLHKAKINVLLELTLGQIYIITLSLSVRA